ncbi:MAG: DUF4388 domain-containing protein [Kofleriaceae bacterium]|nr:DUF4388 domain-containing protein [Kofleriaceae bacterium]
MRAVAGWQVALEPDYTLALAHFRTLLPDVVILFAGPPVEELVVLATDIQNGSHGRPASLVLVAKAGFAGATTIPHDELVVYEAETDVLEERITSSCRAISAKRIRIAMDLAIDSFVCDAMDSLSASADTVSAQAEAASAGQDLDTEASPAKRVETELLGASGTPLSTLESRTSTSVLEAPEVYLREETVSVDMDSVETDSVKMDDVEMDGIESGYDPDSDVDTPATPSGSDFARQLREKMSKMAERLFPAPLRNEDTISLVSAPPDNQDFDLSDGSELGLTELSDADEVSFVSSEEMVSDSDIERERSYRPREEPESRLLSFTGELGDGDDDVSRLIARFWHTRFTGWITFRAGERELRLDFDQGRVVFVASKSSDDRMGELLVRQGKINREQLANCQTQVSASGRRMGELLVELGYLKPRELLPAVRQHLEDLYYSLFAWTEGSFEAVQGVTDDEKIRLSRHPAALIVEGVRRKYDRSRLTTCLGDSKTVVFALPSEALSKTLGSAELTLGETKAHALFSGENMLEEIANNSGIQELAVAQLAFAWVCLGVAEVISGEWQGQTRPGRGTQPLIGDSDIEIDRERALAKHRLIQMGDYFEVLGVRQDASAFEIKRAYEAAQRYYKPSALPSELRTELEDVLREIEEVIEEAYLILSNDVIRLQYRANIQPSKA